MGERTPAGSENMEVPADVLERIRPLVLTRAQIGSLAVKDKWFRKIQADLKTLEATVLPTAGQLKAQWSLAVNAYCRFIRMRYEQEWHTQKIKITKARLERRLIELREAEESRCIHALKVKLGAKFLHAATTANQSLNMKSLSRSENRKAIKPLQPLPSE